MKIDFKSVKYIHINKKQTQCHTEKQNERTLFTCALVSILTRRVRPGTGTGSDIAETGRVVVPVAGKGADTDKGKGKEVGAGAETELQSEADKVSGACTVPAVDKGALEDKGAEGRER